jgi:hypothetical protein
MTRRGAPGAKEGTANYREFSHVGMWGQYAT